MESFKNHFQHYWCHLDYSAFILLQLEQGMNIQVLIFLVWQCLVTLKDIKIKVWVTCCCTSKKSSLRSLTYFTLSSVIEKEFNWKMINCSVQLKHWEEPVAQPHHHCGTRIQNYNNLKMEKLYDFWKWSWNQSKVSSIDNFKQTKVADIMLSPLVSIWNDWEIY